MPQDTNKLIKNYGLFWKREGVHWNAGGKRGSISGHLKGETNINRRVTIVDFRSQVGIYCLYDKDYSLLYVGQAGNGNSKLFDRLVAHTRDDLAERWVIFSWFGFHDVNLEANPPTLITEQNTDIDLSHALNALEGILIVSAEPPLNRRGPNFGDSTKYKQHWDFDSIYPSSDEMLRQIYDIAITKYSEEDMEEE